MANLFYGVCSTAANSDEKAVTLLEENTIQVGDSLVVYFANGNTHISPSLSIAYATGATTGETENTALTTNSGVTIKSSNAESNLDYMWHDGEAVIFTLVEQEVNSGLNSNFASNNEGQPATNNIQYWMINRGIRANVQYYGLTHLWDVNELNTALTSGLTGYDPNSVVTIETLKQFYDSLTSVQTTDETEDDSSSEDTPSEETSEDTVTTPLFGLQYTNMVGTDGTKIGELSFGYSGQDSNSVNLYIPARTESQTVTLTSQLTNDGQGSAERASDVDGSYYITNLLDKNLYFTGDATTASELGIVRKVDDDNYELLTNLNAASNNSNSAITYLNKGYKDGALFLYGSPIALFTNTDTSASTIRISNTELSSTIPVYATEFYEDTLSLGTKYSYKLERITVRFYGDESAGYIVLNDGKSKRYSQTYTFNNTKVLGVLGYNISYAKDTNGNAINMATDASFMNVWECYTDESVETSTGVWSTTIHMAFRNIKTNSNSGNEDRSFYVTVDLLAERQANWGETSPYASSISDDNDE